MKDSEKRLVKALDELCEGIAKRPGMYTGCFDDLNPADAMIRTLLHLRSLAIGSECNDPSTWLKERYPHIPGSVRSIAEAAENAYSYEERLETFEDDSLDFIAWAIREMEKKE